MKTALFYIMLLSCAPVKSTQTDSTSIIIEFRYVYDGKPSKAVTRKIEQGTLTKNIKAFLVNSADTSWFDQNLFLKPFNNSPNTDLILLFEDNTLKINNFSQYICSNHFVKVKVSFDVLNKNNHNILVSSNSRNCGDLFLQVDSTLLDSPIHILQIENYKEKTW